MAGRGGEVGQERRFGGHVTTVRPRRCQRPCQREILRSALRRGNRLLVAYVAPPVKVLVKVFQGPTDGHSAGTRLPVLPLRLRGDSRGDSSYPRDVIRRSFEVASDDG